MTPLPRQAVWSSCGSVSTRHASGVHRHQLIQTGDRGWAASCRRPARNVAARRTRVGRCTVGGIAVPAGAQTGVSPPCQCSKAGRGIQGAGQEAAAMGGCHRNGSRFRDDRGKISAFRPDVIILAQTASVICVTVPYKRFVSVSPYRIPEPFHEHVP